MVHHPIRRYAPAVPAASRATPGRFRRTHSSSVRRSLLFAVAVCSAWATTGCGLAVDRYAPRETLGRYIEALEALGLTETPVAAGWVAAATAIEGMTTIVGDEYRQDLLFDPLVPTAQRFRAVAERNRLLRVVATTEEPGELFLSAYGIDPSRREENSHALIAEGRGGVLELKPRRDREVTIVLIPEIGFAGRVSIEISRPATEPR